jgi:hypothetical protein
MYILCSYLFVQVFVEKILLYVAYTKMTKCPNDTVMLDVYSSRKEEIPLSHLSIGHTGLRVLSYAKTCTNKC